MRNWRLHALSLMYSNFEHLDIIVKEQEQCGCCVYVTVHGRIMSLSALIAGLDKDT